MYLLLPRASLSIILGSFGKGFQIGYLDCEFGRSCGKYGISGTSGLFLTSGTFYAWNLSNALKAMLSERLLRGRCRKAGRQADLPRYALAVRISRD